MTPERRTHKCRTVIISRYDDALGPEFAVVKDATVSTHDGYNGDTIAAVDEVQLNGLPIKPQDHVVIGDSNSRPEPRNISVEIRENKTLITHPAQ
jgi:hypothetical protein